MIDAFDAEFDKPAPAVRTYEIAPPGRYVAEIVKAERKRVPWKANDANPHGDCTVLRLSVGREFGFVFCDVPDDMPWLKRHIALACGLDADELVPDRLIGRRANITIKNYVTRDGSRKAAVGRWLPVGPAQSATGRASLTLTDAIHEWDRQPPATNPSRNAVKRHTHDEDDFPF